MTWLVWRQHRVQFTLGAALLAALAVLLLITGLPLHHAYPFVVGMLMRREPSSAPSRREPRHPMSRHHLRRTR